LFFGDALLKETSLTHDMDEAAAVVNIRAVRRKPPHRTTGAIL